MKMARQIAVIALLWLIFVNPGIMTSIDTIRRLSMSHAWWTGTEEGFPGNKIVISVNDKKYIPYDLGQSILMLPGDWLGEQLGQSIKNELIREHFRGAIVSFLIFVPLNLLAVLTCFRFLRLLNYSEKVSGLSSLVWLIGTSILFYSSFHQQNNQILLFVLLSYQAALMYLIKNKKYWAILSGVALGFTFIIRITNIIYVASILLFLIGCNLSREKTRSLSVSFRPILLWMSGFVPFLLLERILTYIRYGSWTATTVSLHLQIYNKAGELINSTDTVVEGTTKSFPFLKLLTKVKPEALFAPFFSPEKSIFIYDPLVLPCLILLVICWKYLSKYIRWYVIAATVGFLLHLYIYSWSLGWIDQGAWGARYHITSIHLLLVPLIPLLIQGAIEQIAQRKNLFKKILILGARAIVVLAICIQFSSIAIDGVVEAYQQRLGIGSSLRIVQRFKNISEILNGSSIKTDVNITSLEDSTETIALQEKIESRSRWNILPFLYQKKLAKSPLNKIIPILIAIWGLILLAAIVATIRIFVV
ncbi:glycosyltransferase family 39 protein [Pleurocapsa sp. PCC 7319]|uniref:glycosyltransferase family 39 protein n=1 Tax=Pleurocapsa sp. PCC 7319 TaxID=118161 RepID=UPI000347F633|nr:glycosyltransferase family 39 protein [Pleurocapsa sp. PCC 7319]